MTAQSPEQLENAHPEIDFGKLYLYRVITGDITANHGWGDPYPFQNQPQLPGDQKPFSALWRGYVGSFHLGADGKLTLKKYTYPNSPTRGKHLQQTVNEELVGDFWLVMKLGFRAPRTYVPFQDGVIVTNRDEWVCPTDD